MGALMEDRAWLARVLSPDGHPAGAAFAIDSERILTCAHVAAQAGGCKPGDSVKIDFPCLGAQIYEAEILAEGWAPVAGTAGDVALLRIAKAPAELRPAPVRALHSVEGLTSAAYGFPIGYDDGRWVTTTLGLAAGREWVQMEVESQLAVEPGFSGSAIWSRSHSAVVAMMVTRDAPSRGRVAFAIPIQRLAKLFSPLDLDPETAIHWGPRSRGVNSDLDNAGWLFTGRESALIELVTWLASGDRQVVKVVTGQPGTGKSALLARLVTTADRHYRTRIPDLADDDPTVPPAGAVDVTFHANGQNVAAFVEHAASICSLTLSGSTAGALVDGIRHERATKAERFEEAQAQAALLDEARKQFAEREPGVLEERRLAEAVRLGEARLTEANRRIAESVPDVIVVVVDAVDEAVEPKAMCTLLGDLSELGWHIVVGCRDYLVTEFRASATMRLDDAAYSEPGDIEAYVGQLLADRQAGTLVEEIAEAAEGNFLVAQLVAHGIVLGGDVVRPFPRTVSQAFDRLLLALPDPRSTRELLLTLAYAKGDGLTRDLWCSGAGALSRPYYPADVDELLVGPAVSFLITRSHDLDGARYRLFHEAVVDTLGRGRDRAYDEARLWSTWTAALSSSPGSIWRNAPAYLLQHGAEHAAAAGALDELAGEMTFLLYADLTRLLIQLTRSTDMTSPRVAQSAASLRTASPMRMQPLRPEERAEMIVLAARHLGLSLFAAEALTATRVGWRPSWAHRLGAPHLSLTGHNRGVRSVAIGRTGGREIIVSASDDWTVRVWDALSGEALGVLLAGHVGAITAVAAGVIGTRGIFASASRDETVGVWDTSSLEAVCPRLVGHSGAVNAVAIGTADGRAIVASGGDDRTVRVWDALTGRLIYSPLQLHFGRVTAVAFGRAAGRLVVVSSSEDRTIAVCDALSGRSIVAPIIAHKDYVRTVATGEAASSAIIASAGGDEMLRIWDADSGEPLAQRAVPTGAATAVAVGFAGDRLIVASAGDTGVQLSDALTLEIVGVPLHGHTGSVDAVAVGTVGGRPVIASGSSDRTVRVWDGLGLDALDESLGGHAGEVVALAFSTAGDLALLASAGRDRTVRVWSADSGEQVGTSLDLGGHPVQAIAIGTARGRATVVVATDGGTLRLWDALSGVALGSMHNVEVGQLRAVAIIGMEGHELIAVAGRDRKVRVWDATTGEIREPGRTTRTPTVVDAATFGLVADRWVVALVGRDRQDKRVLWCWDVLTGEALVDSLVVHEATVSAVAIGTANGRVMVASAGWDEAVRVCDVQEGTRRRLTSNAGPVNAVAIGTHRGDGRTLIASAHLDRTVALWDGETSEKLHVIRTLHNPRALTFGSDGALYIAAGVAVCRFDASEQI